MRFPHHYFLKMVVESEGGFQNDPDDSGNYAGTVLIGTNHGVTPQALATFMNVGLATITVQMIRDVTPDMAANIGERQYYEGTGLDLLPFSPVVESAVDWGWMSGPGRAVRGLQEEQGSLADGLVGPLTIGEHEEWIRDHGMDVACNFLANARVSHVAGICAARPSKLKYQGGWVNRINRFRPTHEPWWSLWAEDLKRWASAAQ